MNEKHMLIREKLERYPADVQQLAKKAMLFAEELSESAIHERLKGVIRQIVRAREESK